MNPSTALAAALILTSTPNLRADPLPPAFTFRDVAEVSGLLPDAAGIHAHGAAWGDIDGDSFPELYIGTFHKPGSKPNLLFRNRGADLRFSLDPDKSLQFSSRATGVVFADLDNDGDLDLYVGSMPQRPNKRSTTTARGCALFQNDGTGKFTDISDKNGACPAEFGARSVAVLDFDGDGLLDLLVAEDPIPGYNGSPTSSTRLFRNLGGLRFEDATRAARIPENSPGLGVAACDVNNDSWPDIFIASHGANILLLNNRDGTFRPCPGTGDLFQWEGAGGDSMVCGVSFGDVNRDGLQDIVIGQHFEKPWQSPLANRLYLNRGIKDGVPSFENVTSAVGLAPLPMKAPHVEIQDFDNDGWPDILTSIVKFDADGHPHPVIFKNLGPKDGLPQFSAPALTVNPFPTDADRAVNGTGDFFSKMLADRQIIYSAPAPVADFDNDGLLDIFLGNWWKESPSLLLHNETKNAHRWIRVKLDLTKSGANRSGIGARIEVYPAGKLGQRAALLGSKEIATGFGYASGQPATAHFGLGEIDTVDLRIILPHGKGTLDRLNLPAGREATLKD